MSKQFKRNNHKSGPDADQEFIFTSRSICLEEEEDRTELSAITDHHFGAIDSYRRAQALPPVSPDAQPLFPPLGPPPLKYQPSQEEEERRSPPPSDCYSSLPQQSSSSNRSHQSSSGSHRSLSKQQQQQQQNTDPSSRSLQSKNSQSKNSVRSFVQQELEEEDYENQNDDDDVYMDEFLPENSQREVRRSATREQFVARVAAWSQEVEAKSGGGSPDSSLERQSLSNNTSNTKYGFRSNSVRSSSSAMYLETQPLPEQPMEEIESKRRDRSRRKNNLLVPIILVCICLLAITGGAAVMVVFVVRKDNNDDEDAVAPPEDTKEGGGVTILSTNAAPTATTSAQSVATSTQPAATTPAPVVQRTLSLSGGPFTASGDRFGTNPMFGHALALVGDYLAVGEPNVQSSALGDIVVIRRRSGAWETRDKGFTVAGTRRFGYSMHGTMAGGTAPGILVGASETRDDGPLSNSGAGFGSAHFYQLDSSGEVWTAVGSELRPTASLPEAGGKFGSAVAVASDVLRVAIGAPESSVDPEKLKTGRVYAYEFDGTDWQPMGSPIVGTGAGDRIGASVAMSKGGTRMLVGSPGDHSGAGAVWYYEWDPSLSQWKSIFALRGQDNSEEALGTTVAILSDDGRRIAFGAPTWGNNQGRIEIFEESTVYKGFFAKVGSEDILGNDGDRVGSTLCGAKGLLAFGTESGSFRMYELDPSNNKLVNVVDGPDLGSPVMSIAMKEDTSSIALGLDNQRVHVYDLL